jgi:hypothetical protein
VIRALLARLRALWRRWFPNTPREALREDAGPRPGEVLMPATVAPRPMKPRRPIDTRPKVTRWDRTHC